MAYDDEERPGGHTIAIGSGSVKFVYVHITLAKILNTEYICVITMKALYYLSPGSSLYTRVTLPLSRVENNDIFLYELLSTASVSLFQIDTQPGVEL